MVPHQLWFTNLLTTKKQFSPINYQESKGLWTALYSKIYRKSQERMQFNLQEFIWINDFEMYNNPKVNYQLLKHYYNCSQEALRNIDVNQIYAKSNLQN